MNIIFPWLKRISQRQLHLDITEVLGRFLFERNLQQARSYCFVWVDLLCYLPCFELEKNIDFGNVSVCRLQHAS